MMTFKTDNLFKQICEIYFRKSVTKGKKKKTDRYTDRQTVKSGGRGLQELKLITKSNLIILFVNMGKYLKVSHSNQCAMLYQEVYKYYLFRC